MSVMERTTYRRSLGSNALAFDEPRRDPQHVPHTSGPSTDFPVDDSIPLLLFLSDLQASAARTRNEAAAPSKTLDAETLAALMTRAKNLLALGDIAAARLVLERPANAEDASAAFLLAQTYD